MYTYIQIYVYIYIYVYIHIMVYMFGLFDPFLFPTAIVLSLPKPGVRTNTCSPRRSGFSAVLGTTWNDSDWLLQSPADKQQLSKLRLPWSQVQTSLDLAQLYTVVSSRKRKERKENTRIQTSSVRFLPERIGPLHHLRLYHQSLLPLLRRFLLQEDIFEPATSVHSTH